MAIATYAWVDALEARAPDIVAAWRGIEEDRFISVRREVRKRAVAGTAEQTVVQLATLADALSEIVRRIPDDLLAAPGGEADWNIAEATGHVADSRAGLCLAAAKAAGGMWPADARPVVPGIPGPADAGRLALMKRIAQSQRIVERAGRTIAGHESDPCPLEHPLVGRLRCGEWMLFAGVHDLMHLEQLHDLVAAAP
jgi:hypothetical protein